MGIPTQQHIGISILDFYTARYLLFLNSVAQSRTFSLLLNYPSLSWYIQWVIVEPREVRSLVNYSLFSTLAYSTDSLWTSRSLPQEMSHIKGRSYVTTHSGPGGLQGSLCLGPIFIVLQDDWLLSVCFHPGHDSGWVIQVFSINCTVPVPFGFYSSGIQVAEFQVQLGCA